MNSLYLLKGHFKIIIKMALILLLSIRHKGTTRGSNVVSGNIKVRDLTRCRGGDSRRDSRRR
jgi:hypothetical protein